jgi:hypothetical protein
MTDLSLNPNTKIVCLDQMLEERRKLKQAGRVAWLRKSCCISSVPCLRPACMAHRTSAFLNLATRPCGYSRGRITSTCR